MPDVLAYILLCAGVGVFFIFSHLLMGRFVRPVRPSPEKKTIYECGEPTIGSAWIQFDLRFYVVALLFVIFDVEMAFFFPWAVVFGKANQLSGVMPNQQRIAVSNEALPPHEYKEGTSSTLTTAPKDNFAAHKQRERFETLLTADYHSMN